MEISWTLLLWTSAYGNGQAFRPQCAEAVKEYLRLGADPLYRSLLGEKRWISAYDLVTIILKRTKLEPEKRERYEMVKKIFEEYKDYMQSQEIYVLVVLDKMLAGNYTLKEALQDLCIPDQFKNNFKTHLQYYLDINQELETVVDQDIQAICKFLTIMNQKSTKPILSVFLQNLNNNMQHSQQTNYGRKSII